MNLRDHTLAWLDLIGADGLMMPDGSIELIKTDLPSFAVSRLSRS